MHIPDTGMLDAKTCLATAALALGGLGIALHQARRRLPRRRIPLMGLAAAFVFAAQMVNFPVAAGTSGHLVGGVLAAVLLGPAAAVVVMTAVLIVQCLVFSDGGLLALGANLFNMAIVNTVGGWGIYYLVHRLLPSRSGQIVATAFAAWCATVLAAVCCAGEIAFSGVAHWAVLPAMGGIHMLIGIGEAVITAMVLAAVAGTRPELLGDEREAPSVRIGPVVAFGLIIALGLGIFASPFASERPDGLERVTTDMGLSQEGKPLIAAPLPDYKLSRIPSPTIATAAAGGIGTILVFGLSLLLARALSPSIPKATAAPAT